MFNDLSTSTRATWRMVQSGWLTLASWILLDFSSRSSSVMTDHSQPSVFFRYNSASLTQDLKTGYCSSSRPIPAHCAPCPVNTKATRGFLDDRRDLNPDSEIVPLSSLTVDATTNAFQSSRERRSLRVNDKLSK